jgi:hypothetical protein
MFANGTTPDGRNNATPGKGAPEMCAHLKEWTGAEEMPTTEVRAAAAALECGAPAPLLPLLPLLLLETSMP